MKLCAFLVLLCFASSMSLPGQTSVSGDWYGSAVSHGQQVPMHLRIGGASTSPNAALINGPEIGAASDVTFSGHHLLVTFSYFARTIDATLSPEGKLTGTFGTTSVRYPISLTRTVPRVAPQSGVPANVAGDWEIAVKSVKGESAWQLHVEPTTGASAGASIRAVIQRIDGDTGSLYGECAGSECLVSHLTPAGPALYRLAPQPGGQTLVVSNLLRADQTSDRQQDLVARRPAAARAAQLAPPTDPTQQTTMKDPSARFAFRAPDLAGRVVSNTDPQFDGKVVLVTVGGSWCPNCHDEAPFLQTLYNQFHGRGLEVVNLSFEEDEDQVKNPARLRAFIARYQLTYTILLAGVTDELNEKIPQAEHLNSWPTSFILGRNGRVREVHAGFAGPANPPAHAALVKEMTELIERLLDEPAPTQSASVRGRP